LFLDSYNYILILITFGFQNKNISDLLKQAKNVNPKKHSGKQYHFENKHYIIPKGQSKMENPEKLAIACLSKSDMFLF
jgi:negative regulator of genetic competence, sporulation and motility